MSACKDCGREIDWMQTEKGRYIPVDPEPEFVIEGDGDEHFYTEEEGVLSGRLARRSEVQTREAKINTAGVCAALADLPMQGRLSAAEGRVKPWKRSSTSKSERDKPRSVGACACGRGLPG